MIQNLLLQRRVPIGATDEFVGAEHEARFGHKLGIGEHGALDFGE